MSRDPHTDPDELPAEGSFLAGAQAVRPLRDGPWADDLPATSECYWRSFNNPSASARGRSERPLAGVIRGLSRPRSSSPSSDGYGANHHPARLPTDTPTYDSTATATKAARSGPHDASGAFHFSSGQTDPTRGSSKDKPERPPRARGIISGVNGLPASPTMLS